LWEKSITLLTGLERKIKKSISSSQTWEELDLIKKNSTKQAALFKAMLLELANNKQDELKQAFLQKIILGVSISAVILVIFILVSWWK
jgi:hypothetical protein